MKGQYRIINEILLFGMSAIVVFSIAGVISFATDAMKAQTQREQYILMGNLASMAMTKAYICGKLAQCEFIAEIPDKLSEDSYTITLSRGQVEVANFQTGSPVDVKAMDFKKNLGGFVTSNGRYFMLTSGNDTILLTR